MVEYYPYIIIVVGAYLIGSIPTSYIVGKLFFSLDLREHGSGNVGATNALRVLGKKAGSFVLAADMGKGLIAVFFSRFILKSFGLSPSDKWAVIAGGCAILGHIYTLWLKFKGGKGVATSAGVFLALSPLALAVALTAFGLTVWTTGYVSLGSIIGALVITPMIRLNTGRWDHPCIVLAVIATAFIIVKHRANISRLLNGTENRIGTKKNNEESTDKCQK